MINDAQDDNVVIDMMNDSPAPNPLDEFEEEDDNDFLNEPEKEEQPSPFMEQHIEQQENTLVDDFQVREEKQDAVNNDAIVDSSREKMLFDKLGNYFSLLLSISAANTIFILSLKIKIACLYSHLFGELLPPFLFNQYQFLTFSYPQSYFYYRYIVPFIWNKIISFIPNKFKNTHTHFSFSNNLQHHTK